MPNIIEITDLSAPELDVYARLTEAQLRNRLEPDKGVFIAESPKVIATALDAGYEPLSLLMERRHIEGDAQPILARCGGIPVYTAERETLARLTGFELSSSGAARSVTSMMCGIVSAPLPSPEQAGKSGNSALSIANAPGLVHRNFSPRRRSTEHSLYFFVSGVDTVTEIWYINRCRYPPVWWNR